MLLDVFHFVGSVDGKSHGHLAILGFVFPMVTASGQPQLGAYSTVEVRTKVSISIDEETLGLGKGVNLIVRAFQGLGDNFGLLLGFFRDENCFVCVLVENIDVAFAFLEKLLLVGHVFEVLIQQRVWAEMSVLVVKVLGNIGCFENLKVFRRSSVYPLETWT